MFKRQSILILLTAGSLVAGLAPTAATAIPIGFGCISNNNATDCAIGEAQLSVDVTDAGGSQVLFTFSNSGPLLSAITDVYFDDGTLLGIAGLIDLDDNALGPFGDAGVDFSTGASPADLPGGGVVGFVTTAGFSADADAPVAFEGVDPGETLGIVFDLIGGGNFADIIAELTNGDLRIGIHVQDYSGGGSESFVNVPVPEPGTALLIGLGLVGLALSPRNTA